MEPNLGLVFLSELVGTAMLVLLGCGVVANVVLKGNKGYGGGFLMMINATDRKREKLAAQLTWIANKHELGLPEDRRHDRLTPRNTRSEITLDDGRRYPCRLLDLSLSGAAVDIETRPSIGTPLRLGNMRGRVVRHFMEGVAIEFHSVQSREALTEFL